MAGNREKVVVAMSGGVDSSVAACLLAEQGYDVVGLFMRVGATEPSRAAGLSPRDDAGGEGAAKAWNGAWAPAEPPNRTATVRERSTECADVPLPHGRGSEAGSSPDSDAQPGKTSSSGSPRGPKSTTQGPSRSHQGCCSAADAADARFVAGMLGIPFYALNFQEDFDRIIDYFADEYVRGRTPNPCVVCNDKLKFGKLVDYADAVGAKYIATGHYARIEERNGRKVLLRGRDPQKDQSYVLFGLDRALLDRVLFPVGELTKSQVREIAARHGLPNQDKPDSVEICFVPDRDYARVVRERRPQAFIEGDVLNPEGRVIGRHKGIGNYTVGQRRGLGIAAGKPIYVTQLNVENNTVAVGEGDDLLSSTLIADRANFLIDPPDGPFRAEVKIRYLHRPAPATVERVRWAPPNIAGEAPGQSVSMAGANVERRMSNVEWSGRAPHRRAAHRFSGAGADSSARVRVTFDEPQRAITPGQAVVFYDGDVVLGGAWIDRAEHAGPEAPGSPGVQ